MAKKRSSLAFPDKADPLGRRAILRGREEIEADEQTLTSQKSGDPETQKSGAADSQTSSGKPDRAQYQKVTYRISPDAVDAIYEARRNLRREHGIKANLEEIAEIAILAAFEELDEKKEESRLVLQLSGDPESWKPG